MKQRILLVIFSIAFTTCYSQKTVTASAGSYSIIRSSVGAGGFSKTIETENGNYIINQSIGQASVIGTYYKNGYILRQGFQQPFVPSGTVLILPENKLNAIIYPNPFHQSINILFNGLITNEVIVTVTDIMGKNIISRKLPSSQLINLPLEYIPDGVYFLKIIAERKQFNTILIKQ